MIKLEATEDFTLNDFDKLKNIERVNKENNEEGKIFYKDTFQCDVEMANYLLGNNPLKKRVVTLIEVDFSEPVKKIDVDFETKPKRKTTTRTKAKSIEKK